MSVHGSVLVPERQPLGLPILLALFGHVFILGMGVVMADCQVNRKPIIDPSQAMEIDLVVLPKSRSSMPEKASRAPVQRGTDAKAPPPETAPPERVSDLKVHSEDAPETQGAPDRTDQRSALMRSLLMKQLVEDIDPTAPIGTQDRQASDPDSDSEEGFGSGDPGPNRADPELARYVHQLQQLFMASFRPLPTITMANPDISCEIVVQFDLDTGKVLGTAVKTSSGNASYDAAAERAVAAVAEVPLPPSRFRSFFKDGIAVRFEPP